jgi:hypothetical protein
MPNPKGHEDSIKDSRFKAAWRSGPTRTIRVPIALADATLEYARQLDYGIEPHDTREIWDDETQAVLTLADFFEPRDTAHDLAEFFGVRTDSVATEPRDTQEKNNNQPSNSVNPKIAESPDTGNLRAELEDARADYAKLLESSTQITHKLREEVAQLRSQLETERADQEEIEAELSELKQNSVPAAKLSEKLAPDAATILSQLRARRKKSKTDLADLEAILEILES